ncbi:hypothetical protein ACNAW0_19725 [Micromonospora sp. SL1-18]|uniref:hypothetical protein n=1 Tax=Micromonospora sp. SL1-18 TaxID=3399128 RepID=UPI003A4DC00B
MARQGWGASTAAALGVAAGTGAAQLGVGYGLGIINWTPTGTVRVEDAWVASLAWATWISATSVVAGAVCAHWLRGGDDEEPDGTLRKLGLAVGATVGALITVLLVAVPARSARVPDMAAPQTVAAGYAAVGLLIGLLLAMWALHTRAVAANLVATTGWLWLLAVVSVVDGVLSGRGLTTAQLGIWQISADSGLFWIRDDFYWPGALLSLGSALVIGALAARRTSPELAGRVGTATSGAAGPLLVGLAYLLAVPRLGAVAAEQLSAHLIAPYAVIAGVGGSVLVAALAQRTEHRAAAREDAADPDEHGKQRDAETGVSRPRQRDAETGVSLPRQRGAKAGMSLPRQRTGEPGPATGKGGRPAVDGTADAGQPATSAGGSAALAVAGTDTPKRKPVQETKKASTQGSATTGDPGDGGRTTKGQRRSR